MGWGWGWEELGEVNIIKMHICVNETLEQYKKYVFKKSSVLDINSLKKLHKRHK